MAASYSHEITGYSKTILEQFIKNRYNYPSIYGLTFRNSPDELNNNFYIGDGTVPSGYNNLSESLITGHLQAVETTDEDGVRFIGGTPLEVINHFTTSILRNYVYILKNKITAPNNPDAGNNNLFKYNVSDFEEMTYADFIAKYNNTQESDKGEQYYCCPARYNKFNYGVWDGTQRVTSIDKENMLLANSVIDDRTYIWLREIFGQDNDASNNLKPSIMNYTVERDDIIYCFLSRKRLTGEFSCQITEYESEKYPLVVFKLKFLKSLMRGICDNCYFNLLTNVWPSGFLTGRKADNTFWNDIPYYEENVAPYSGGGYTEPSSPSSTGTWTRPHNTIDGNPTGYNDLDAGLFRVYSLTKQQLSAFANKLWNPAILEAIAQHFSDPTGVVISLHSFPFIVPHNQYDELIQFNWIPKWLDGVEVKGYSLSQEYYTVDFGDVKIDRFSGTFYDYQPYSSAQLYLPYVGFVNLKMNEILDGTLNVKYNINIITGDFTANVLVKNKVDPVTKETFNLLIGCYSGNMARPLPLSRQDMLEVYKTGIELAKTVASVAMGVNNGIAAATATQVARDKYDEILKYNNKASIFNERNAKYGFNLPDLPLKPQLSEPESVMDSFKNGFSSNNNSSLDVAGANAPIGRSGSLGSVLGRCTEQTPFILLSYPHQNISEKQGKLMGYATNLSGTLEDFTGYTEVREIWLTLPTATSSELAEVEKILSGGIII